MKRILALLAVLAVVMAAPAFGEVRPGTVNVSPFLGGYLFDGTQHIETAPMLGLRLGHDCSKRFGAEAFVHGLMSDGTAHNPVGEYDYTQMTVGAEGLWFFQPDARLVPYLAAGPRVVFLDHEKENLGHHDDLFGIAWGAGARYALSKGMSLRGDVRHVWQNEGLHNLEYFVGLVVPIGTIGKGAAPAPAPAPAPAAAPAPPPPPPPAAAPAPPPPPPAPTATLSAVPGSIEKGKCTTLTWSSTDASSAEILPVLGTVSPSGSREVCPGESTTYNMTAKGVGGTATARSVVTVTAPPPPPPPAPAPPPPPPAPAPPPPPAPAPPPPPAAPTATLSANPASVVKGKCTTLTWVSTNASSAEILPVLGTVSPSGSSEVCPGESTTYAMTATGLGGTATAKAPVTVTAPAEEKLTVKLDVQFDTDKAEVKAKYHDEIRKVADFLVKYPGVKGTIEGHTDNVGSAAYNKALSQRRADAIRKVLVDKYKVDPARLSAKGYGFEKPIADNGTEEGRARNRRTVATFDTVTIRK